MNFSLLNNNLCFGEYIYFYQFLKDLKLIFTNSLIWAKDKDQKELIKDAENYFIEQLTDCKGIYFNMKAYNFIVNNFKKLQNI